MLSFHVVLNSSTAYLHNSFMKREVKSDLVLQRIPGNTSIPLISAQRELHSKELPLNLGVVAVNSSACQ